MSKTNESTKQSNTLSLVLYCVWACFNFYLLTGKKVEDPTRFFYPFTTYNLDGRTIGNNFNPKYYDGSEFIVYVIVIPVIIYLIYRYINKSNS